jgi:hypothetical protein
MPCWSTCLCFHTLFLHSVLEERRNNQFVTTSSSRRLCSNYALLVNMTLPLPDSVLGGRRRNNQFVLPPRLCSDFVPTIPSGQHDPVFSSSTRSGGGGGGIISLLLLLRRPFVLTWLGPTPWQPILPCRTFSSLDSVRRRRNNRLVTPHSTILLRLCFDRVDRSTYSNFFQACLFLIALLQAAWPSFLTHHRSACLPSYSR